MKNKQLVVYLLFNFLSSVGIVFANKCVFHHFRYNFATFLTALHFTATWIGTLVSSRLGLYTSKRLKHVDVLPITLSFCSFVVFNNLSLQYNSVGFYQLMKVLTTPVVVILQKIFYKVELPARRKFSLIPICLGVALSTVHEFSLSLIGSIWAMAGILATAFYQLLIKTRQDKLGVDSFQLLHYQAPQSAILVLACTPIFDHVLGADGFIEFTYTASAIWAIGLSCLLAYCVNLSTYLIIGHTSPVSYQVLGNFKLIVILLIGIIFFSEVTNYVRLFGMILALYGIISYSLDLNLEETWKYAKSIQTDTPMQDTENPKKALCENPYSRNHGVG